MCGIVGYTGPAAATQILLAGLARLEYRGYDSAGLAVHDGARLNILKREGRLAALRAAVTESPLPGTAGIGHNRWATHGAPTESNAHPQTDCSGGIAVVHNGIIENDRALRRELIAGGHTFRSETDTEVFAHLIEDELTRGAADLAEAVRRALARAQGAWAIAVASAREPGRIVAARRDSPLVLGAGVGEWLVASDVAALLDRTRRVVWLDDGEVAELSPAGAIIRRADGSPRPAEIVDVDWSLETAERGGFETFMRKEIAEQPEALRRIVGALAAVPAGTDGFAGLRLDPARARAFTRAYLVGCGTAWHAALCTRDLFERCTGLPAQAEVASEFRYRGPALDAATLVVAVTQSGETADTLGALRLARRAGATVIAVCNVVGSSAAREADTTLLTLAGPEIGVAATKSYLNQIVALAGLCAHLGALRGVAGAAATLEGVPELPGAVEAVLAAEDRIRAIAHRHAEADGMIFLGRGPNVATAFEGALKTKELAYLHAEGYPAGEMKHGPIALIHSGLPVVVIAPAGATRDKIASNIREVAARGGRVVALTTAGDAELAGFSEDVIGIPATSEHLSPVVAAVPLQLLAYHLARERGCDIDNPRNLAKSVTVE